MARDVPDLDLYHPWDLDADEAAGIARDCEDAARAVDPRISNSEGATLYTQRSSFIYGNSHGFVGGYPTTRHSLSCAVIAQQGDEMQRDYWYDSSRLPAELAEPAAIGRRAAERTLARLDGRQLGTRECPVLFRADVAPSLLRSLFGAIRGHAVYRKSTFLLDQVGEQIFPDWVRISEDPLLPRGQASAPFDNEGVATGYRDLVADGVLQGYLLDSYSARKLGLQSTASAGGVRNAGIASSGQSFDELLREMDHGVVVTELMGQGTNPVTGDYSRGAAGFWVENGEMQYPVDEITVAGNLKDMFRQLLAVGSDNDIPGSIDTGSWLIERMTVGGD
jgi:PmbA protein